ncbi:hypothetical protein Gpo141_00012787 [Globisporangium polare]
MDLLKRCDATRLDSTAISVYYGDLRALSATLYWLASPLNICVDTNMQPHQFAGTSVLAILYQLCLLVTVSLQLTPHTHTVTLMHCRLHSMTSNDVVVNTVGTPAILMVRTAYRKRQSTKRRRKTTFVGSPVRHQPVSRQASTEGRRVVENWQLNAQQEHRPRAQLRGAVVLCILRVSLDQIVFEPSKSVQDSVLWKTTRGEDDRIILHGNVAALDRRDDHALTLRNLLALPKWSRSIQPASGAT